MKHETAIESVGTPAIFKLLPEDRFFTTMADLHRLIARRAYGLFAERGFEDGHELEDWLRAESELVKSISWEVSETEDAITVKATLSGYSAKEIEIHVDPTRLFISGQQREKSGQKKGQTIRSEQRLNQIFRGMELPSLIDPEKVRASLSSGELQIELPKIKAGEKASIAVKAAA
jgi:HSP20 family molecular chaperone IbpA